MVHTHKVDDDADVDCNPNLNSMSHNSAVDSIAVVVVVFWGGDIYLLEGLFVVIYLFCFNIIVALKHVQGSS